MSQNIIYKNGEDVVLVPTGQSIAINSSWGGTTRIYYLISAPNNPPVYKLQTTLLNSNTILGPMSADTYVRIEPGNATVFYDVGVTPNTGVGDADTVGGYEPDITDTPSTVVIRDTFGNIEATAFESTVATGTAPLVVASTTLVTNLNADLLDGIDSTTVSTPTSIPVRDFNGDITANAFISDVATGTAPLVVDSTTTVTNLSADMVDGIQGSQIMVNDADNTTTGDITISNTTPSIFFEETDDSSNQAEIGRDGTYLYIRNEDIRITDSSGGDVSSFTIRTGGAYNTIWHAGNHGPGSGLDADTLDTINSTQFLRSDTADSVDGVLTYTVGPILNNSIYLSCKESGATNRTVIGMDGTDVFNVGNVNNAIDILSNGTLTHNGSPLSVLNAWEENGDDLRPVVSGVGTLGDSTHFVESIYFGDSDNAYFGDSQDLYINFNGTNSEIYSAGDLYLGTVDSNNLVVVTNNTARWVFGNTGNLTPYVGSTYNIGSSSYRVNEIYSGDIYQGDNDYHYFGDSNDGYIYFDGTDLRIYSQNAGSDLRLYYGTSMVLNLGSTPSDRYVFSFNNFYPEPNGAINCGTSTHRWDTIYCVTLDESSDIRLKHDVKPSFLGLDFINALDPIAFTFEHKKGVRHGFSAQQVLSVVEGMGYSIEDFSAISRDDEDNWGLSYTQFIAPIIRAIQEIDKKVEDALL